MMQKVAANSNQMANNSSPVEVVQKLSWKPLQAKTQISVPSRQRCRDLGCKQEDHERY
jgi:hypothetical protein